MPLVLQGRGKPNQNKGLMLQAESGFLGFSWKLINCPTVPSEEPHHSAVRRLPHP